VIRVVAADSFYAAVAALAILTASFIAACGVIWRALRNLWRAIHDLDHRMRKLHDLTDPNGKEDKP
jgi:hypothetical protein